MWKKFTGMAVVRLTSGAGQAAPDRLSAKLEIATSTSLFKSDQWSLLKMEVEVLILTKN